MIIPETLPASLSLVPRILERSREMTVLRCQNQLSIPQDPDMQGARAQSCSAIPIRLAALLDVLRIN